MSLEKVRVDRWLWAVRAYKTRSLATDACKRNWVSVNGTKIKPSREIRAKDIITFKKGPLERVVKVLSVLEKRISPKLVEKFLEDLTPKINYVEAENKKGQLFHRLLECDPQKVGHLKRNVVSWKTFIKPMKIKSPNTFFQFAYV